MNIKRVCVWCWLELAASGKGKRISCLVSFSLNVFSDQPPVWVGVFAKLSCSTNDNNKCNLSEKRSSGLRTAPSFKRWRTRARAALDVSQASLNGIILVEMEKHELYLLYERAKKSSFSWARRENAKVGEREREARKGLKVEKCLNYVSIEKELEHGIYTHRFCLGFPLGFFSQTRAKELIASNWNLLPANLLLLLLSSCFLVQVANHFCSA